MDVCHYNLLPAVIQTSILHLAYANFCGEKKSLNDNLGIHQAEQLVSQVARAEIMPAHLGLGMPGEVEIVGLAGYEEIEGQGIVIDHIIPHVRQLCIQTCKKKENSKARKNRTKHIGTNNFQDHQLHLYVHV